MGFDEKIINQVKEMADFMCCRCKHVSFQVHHIIPQESGGPDTLENAAPLCPNCHADFGDNPKKRKEITQMRDLWYKRVKERYNSQLSNFHEQLNEINLKLDALATNKNNALINLKQTLKELAIETIEQMTVGTAQITASSIANASVSPSSKDAPSNVTPSLSPSVGGAGGGIFIFSKNFSGTGKILVDGGNGKIGGRAGEIHIETQNNNFEGELSAKGGKSNN